MRIITIFANALCASIALSFSAAYAQQESWHQIGDPNEVRQFISDKTLDGKYWKFYFRSDGKMAYNQNGFTSFREWTINADGAICMNIYGMPDKVLECQVLWRTDGKPVQYRLEHPRGISEFTIAEPDQSMIDALLQKAGAVE